MAKRITTQKYPEDKWWITGEAKAGKSTLARAWLNEVLTPAKPDCYIWPTDDRLQEYVHALGEQVLVPDVISYLDVVAVAEAVAIDMRGNEMKKVGGFVLDNMTNVFQDATGVEQIKALSKQGTAGAAKKAAVMKVVGSVITKVSMPLIAISHTYIASTQDLRQKRKRDTISNVEEQRLAKNFNAKMEVISENGRYGVKVLECRDRPGMQSFIIWDEPDNFFKGMPQHIRQALYDESQTPKDEPKGWADFNEQTPFPRDNAGAIKPAAVRMALEYCVVHDGEPFFPFGDPNQPYERKDGTEGPSPAHSIALNAYDKIYEGRSDFGKPKSAGQMTVWWRQYVEEKVQKAIAAYEENKKLPQQVEEPQPEQEQPEGEFSF